MACQEARSASRSWVDPPLNPSLAHGAGKKELLPSPTWDPPTPGGLNAPQFFSLPRTRAWGLPEFSQSFHPRSVLKPPVMVTTQLSVSDFA